MLSSRHLDFVFGTKADFDYLPDFDLEVFEKAKICVVLPRGHKYFDGASEALRISDFKNDVFITLSELELSVPTKQFAEICKTAGFSPKQLVANDLGTLMLWLEVERGISILDKTHVFSSNPHLSFIPLPELGYTELAVSWYRENINPCSKTFIKHIKEYKMQKMR